MKRDFLMWVSLQKHFDAYSRSQPLQHEQHLPANSLM